MFVSQAFAQTASPAGISFLDPQLLMLVLVFAVFYFIVFRPQQQKAKKHREMLNNLRRGDRVLTAGGIIGTVAKVVDDGEVEVDIATGVRVRVAKPTLTQVLSKPEPVAAEKPAKSGKSQKAAAADKGEAEKAEPAAAADETNKSA